MSAGTETIGGVQEAPEDELGEVTEGEETESNEPQASEEEPVEESARDTVRRIINEEKSKEEAQGGDGPEEEEVEEEAEAPEPIKRGPGRPPKEDIPPPARFSAAEKEEFARLKMPQKRAIARMVENHEAAFTRAQQQYAKAANEARSVMEAVQPYVTKWGQRGFTVPAAIAALAAAQERLTDPNTAYDAWLQLGQEIGVDISSLQKQGQGSAQGSQLPDISRHPQFLALQQQLQGVQSFQQQLQAQQQGARVSSIVEELSAVREEKDAYGRYLFPKLHDADFLDSVKPLVEAIAGNVPGISYAEALKRAYYTIEGNSGNQQQPARLPAQGRTAPTGAISVRGRSAPVQTTGPTEIPPEAIQGSARDTVRYFLQQRGS